tara:strand:+ start:4001 stop:4306 length:306 start_codon:yes stop_codon:yes gene_type:complete
MGQINWKTSEQVDKLFKKEKKSVIKIHGADWCNYCKKLKKSINKNAKVINKEWYAIYIDNTEKKDVNVRIYPTTYVWHKNGTNMSIEGFFEEELLKAIINQ